MSTAPHFNIDVKAFWEDPYPWLAEMRATMPIAFIPQLGATVFTRREHIRLCEKRIDVFSSHQPQGLMNTLMGHNLMRKDGDDHLAERKAIFPTVSPKTVRDHWTRRFQAHADRVLDTLAPAREADLVKAYAMPVSAQALKLVTGLTCMRFEDMDAWSQAMIDGIANYTGDRDIEARCHAATAGIDACIDEMLPHAKQAADFGLLSIMLQAGLPLESIRANIKLTISGGQNEPRDAIAGTIWALLGHSGQLDMILSGKATWEQAFDEYVRWISPIGMTPRRVAAPYTVEGVDLEPEDRVFFMFGSANRDEDQFPHGDRFDVTRPNAASHIAFGAGPHFCAGAAASRALVAGVALPSIFARLRDMRLKADEPVRVGGWAFRGVLNLPVTWV